MAHRGGSMEESEEVEFTKFQFIFLGKADVLSSGATGFASLQQPLQKIYFHHLHQNDRGLSQSLCLRTDALVIQSEDNKVEHYPYSNVGYIDYIRFEIFRENKRYYGLFLRQSNRSEKRASGEPVFLDPSVPGHAAIFAHRHKPMAVSVLRRARGVRVLEVHLFATDSELSVVSYVQEVQHMVESHRKRESTHLFQYTPFHDDIQESESFRTTMRHLSKSQTLRHVSFCEPSPTRGAFNKSTSKSEVALTSSLLTSAPQSKPRRSKLKHRIESADGLGSDRAKSIHLSRTKSMSYLSSKHQVSDSDSENEPVVWKEDGSSNKVSKLITRFESRRCNTGRPVARVKPQIVNLTDESFPPQQESGKLENQESRPKWNTTAREKARHKHKIQFQRTKSAEIAEDIQRLNLSKSHGDFQTALGYFP